MSELGECQQYKEYVIYTALFVNDPQELLRRFPPPDTHKNLFGHHMTIAYRPIDGADGIEVGRKVELRIIGRVTTEEVDVLLVMLILKRIIHISPLRLQKVLSPR